MIPGACRAAATAGPGRPLGIIDVRAPRELEPGAIPVPTSAAGAARRLPGAPCRG